MTDTTGNTTDDNTSGDADIFAISSNVVERLADADPLLATIVGLPGRDHRWTDFSPAGVASRRAMFESILAEAENAPTTDRRSVVAQKVLATEMRNEIAAIDSNIWRRDLNNIDSPWQHVREIFELMPMDSAEDWSNIATRLETISEPLDSYREALSVGLDAGDVVARRQVLTAIEQGRISAADASAFGLLLEAFDATDLDRSDDRVATLANRLAVGVDHARMVYGQMTDWLEHVYLPMAVEVDGVGHDAWLASATQKLGTVVDPLSTYDWGWSELERLVGHRSEIARRIDPTSSVDEVLRRVVGDAELVAPTAEAFVEIMQARQDRAVAALDGSHFDVPAEITNVEVRMAPPGGATAAHYLAPSEDFSRAGRVMYPAAGRAVFPLYEEITTAYHEGFPGHHLQIGWQMAMGDALSRFHRLLVWYPGSGEGWALYAEHLMGELGFLERPEYELGLVTSQIFRSARVVIDIGCHLGLEIPGNAVTAGPDAVFRHPGETWDYELGLEMLEHVAHLDPTDAESEMVRYLGWPGQAISYKLGERFLLDLRNEMSAEPDFDLKAWHAKVLSLGSLGLDLLDELMRS